MPKPYITEAGNGLHIHQSLLGADGRNAFAEEDDDPPLRSKLMRRYLSGLLAHQVELQAVNCPTINAYKRVEDYSFAPTQVTWGLDHRLVGVRSAVGRGSATRLECRWASADANPYLVMAGCLFAGAEGPERGRWPRSQRASCPRRSGPTGSRSRRTCSRESAAARPGNQRPERHGRERRPSPRCGR